MKTRTANGKLKAIKYAYDDEDLISEDIDGDIAEAIAGEYNDTSDDEFPSLKKRRQSHNNTKTTRSASSSTNTGKVKGKIYRGMNVGRLSKMLEMPVDIFCEVSAYLEPLDVLRLARSTKGLNNMLMSRNSRPIWRIARNYYPDLPDCPPDLSEPEYARLVFERDCHVCLAPRTLKVEWTLRARICHRCRSSSIMRGTQLIKAIPDLTETLLECVPCRNDNGFARRYRRLEYFYTFGVQTLVAKFRIAVPQDLPETQKEIKRNEFYDRYRALIPEIRKHAVEIQKWLASDQMNKIMEGSEAIRRRKASIRANLVELGYTEQDFPNSWDEPYWDRVMEQRRDLTPRIWTAVRPKLEACIRRAKTRREESSRLSRKNMRRWELEQCVGGILWERKKQDQQLSMHLGNVLELPTIDAMIKEDDYRQPITSTKWDASWDQIEKEMNGYADNAREGLIKLITVSPQNKASAMHGSVLDSVSNSPSPGEVNADVDRASLLSATTLFKCRFCPGPCWYPALLDHSHISDRKWTLSDFSFNAIASAIAKSLYPSLQLKQSEADWTIGLRLVCLRCDELIRYPMTWNDLVKHFTTEQEWYDREMDYQKSRPSRSVILNNDHALEGLESPMAAALDPAAASAQSEKFRAWAGNPTRPRYGLARCGLCKCKWPFGSERTSREQVELHIRSKHLKDSPEERDILEWWAYDPNLNPAFYV